MELRHLRYFVAVAEELNFTRAARRLYTSQPSLSQQIRGLEEEIGVPLLHRDRHHVELTIAGNVFLTEAKDVLKRANHARQLALTAASECKTQLTIGVVLSAELRVLPSLMPALAHDAPKLSLVVRHLSSTDQIRELRNCSIDGGFMRGPVNDAQIDWVEVLTESIIVVVPSKHPSAKRKKFALHKVGDLPCIATSGALSAAMEQALAPFFDLARSHVTFTRDAPNVLGQINMVKAGLGFAVMPEYARFILPQGVVARPLDWDPPLSVALGFAWRRSDQSAPLRTLKRVLARLSTETRKTTVFGRGKTDLSLGWSA
jgi:LysR family transcriptional regulator, hca operon transcriptional activator